MKTIFNQKLKSFGLLEVLIAGILVVTVIGSTISIRQRATSESLSTQKQAVAYMLAEEGMEAVRQIREDTYLAQQTDIPLLPLNCIGCANVGQTPLVPPNFNMVKIPWYCGWVYSFELASDSNVSRDYIHCKNAANANQLSAILPANGVNWGNFGLNSANPPTYDTGELGNGGPTARIYADSSGGVKLWPTWSLSAPTKLDTGVHSGSSGSASGFMITDKCKGAERIFVRKGTVQPATASILENRRTVGSASPNSQQNNTSVVGGGGNCTDWVPPGGYDEFRRQVLVTPTGPSNESPGNAPAAWFVAGAGGSVDTASHMARVLVRVSWQDQSRATGTNLEQAVLLATYLSDWRPAN